ncbi:MAG: hypothetical protein ACQESH_09445, partial [Campylobacterota bacterium]
IDANFQKFDFSLEGMQQYIDSKNNPKAGGYTDPSVLSQLNAFFDAFKQSYENKDIPKSAHVSSDDMDAATKAMLEQLLSKGALKFLQDFNTQKIEELLEEKRKELEAKYSKEELNDASVQADIEKELSEYKKELLEMIATKDGESDKTLNPYTLKDLLHIKGAKEGV